MRLKPLLPVLLAVAALAGCGKSEDAPSAPAGSIKAVAAPAGSAWSDQVVATDLGVRMGNPNAPLKLIEYGSYTCPHCKDFSAESHEPLVRDFVDTGKISFEYRNMVRDPLDLTASLIAHCGGAEPYFSMSQQLFENQEAMVKQIQSASPDQYQAAASAAPNERFIKLAELGALIDFAKARGLPEDKVRACLADSAKAQKLAQDSENVLKEYPQFPGTPSFLLNGTLLDNTASWPALLAKLHEAGA